jgi:hypothetical protein
MIGSALAQLRRSGRLDSRAKNLRGETTSESSSLRADRHSKKRDPTSDDEHRHIEGRMPLSAMNTRARQTFTPVAHLYRHLS